MDTGQSVPTSDRRSYLGGSEIGPVCGESEYQSPLDVWLRKTGRAPEVEDNPAMESGRVLEAGILELHRRRTGIDGRAHGTLHHQDILWQAATPDRISADGRINVQAKCVGPKRWARWGSPDDGPEAIPTDVWLQVQWEMHAARHCALAFPVEMSHVAAQCGTEGRIYEVPWDQYVIDRCCEIASAFWQCVLDDRMPPTTGASGETLARAFPVVRRPDVDLPTGLQLDLARKYADLTKQIGDLQAEKLRIDAAIKASIRDGAGYQSSTGDVRALWYIRTGSTDWKAVAQHLGATKDLEEKFRREATRALRVTVNEGR